MCVAAAVVGTAVVGGYLSSQLQEDAANSAANAQTNAVDKGVAEQRRQFDSIKTLLSPYMEGNTRSLNGQLNLLGLNGNDAQANAIDGIQNSSLFGSLKQRGENSILQNASATGGLRGGNVQAALEQFSPQLLNQLIEQRYNQLGGLTSLGENAASLTGNAGIQTGNNVTNLLQQQGSAQAGAALATGKAEAGFYNGIGSAVGSYYGYGGGAQNNAGITGSLF